jgi:hypothetical protein
MNVRTDRVALTFGVIFLAVAGLWLASQILDLRQVPVGWIVAGGLVALGLAGIAGASTAAHRRHTDGPDR